MSSSVNPIAQTTQPQAAPPPKAHKAHESQATSQQPAPQKEDSVTLSSSATKALGDVDHDGDSH